MKFSFVEAPAFTRHLPDYEGMILDRKKMRDISSEITEGIEAVRQQREGKITLRTHSFEDKPIPAVDAGIIRDTREKLKMSRNVFARQLRVSARTLEKWEQGRTKPNDQAAALILLVRKYPDTLERLTGL